MTTRTMTHIEIYVPGIELPGEFSAPGPRYNVRQTFSSLLWEAEPHPGGYYFMMLPWTKLFGSGILSLRLPSLLFGIGCILLVIALGALDGDAVVGLAAGAMLALNGWHMLWSQLAKGYVVACFFGLLATLLLLRLSKGGPRGNQVILQSLYSGAILIGMTMSIYLWPIFLAQILWVIWLDRGSLRFPGILNLQFAIMILGSPLLSLALFQNRRPAYISPNPFEALGQFLQFGVLFKKDVFATLPELASFENALRFPVPLLEGISYVPPSSISGPVQAVLVALSLLLLSVGLRSSIKSRASYG